MRDPLSNRSVSVPEAKKRICLIVDHPLRDLEGLVLLGMHLCREGAEVFLVPMYQLNEVFLLRPDFVLVNYVRPVNAFFIKACNASGIRVGVLDTEGGVLRDVEQFARAVCATSDGLGIHLYCTWGERQHQALKSFSVLATGSIVETGCPRYDFAVSPWNQAVQEAPVEADRIILVNTNFPVINPRFQSGDRELRELVGMGRFTEEQLADLVGQAKYAQGELIRAVQIISGRMSDAIFVVRPHPFEDISVYERAFAGYANVQVIQAGGIFPWIKKAFAVVHHNCATAIESFMMGREPVHLAWIDTPMLEQPASSSVSLHAMSIDHLESLLQELWHGRQVTVPTATQENRRFIIRDWFYANDGEAAARVSRAILGCLVNVSAPHSYRVSYLWRIIASLGIWKRKLQFLLLMFSNRRLYELVRKLGGRGRVPAAKILELSQVQSIAKRLSILVRDFEGISVGVCGREDGRIGTSWGYSTLRLFRPSTGREAHVD